MSTIFLLMAQYGGLPIIPIQSVVRDCSSRLSVEKLVRKINDGDVVLPLVRIEASLKAAKGIHLTDLRNTSTSGSTQPGRNVGN